MNIYIVKDFLALILNFALILFTNNVKAIEGNIFNKNSIPNPVIEEEKEKPKGKKEKNKDILEKILLKNKITKIKKLIIIISVYIYYNILIFGSFNVIKI